MDKCGTCGIYLPAYECTLCSARHCERHIRFHYLESHERDVNHARMYLEGLRKKRGSILYDG